MFEAPKDYDGESNNPDPTKNVSKVSLLIEECCSRASLEKFLNTNVVTFRSSQLKMKDVGMIVFMIVAFICFYIIVEDKIRATNIENDLTKMETDITDMWKDLESKMGQGGKAKRCNVDLKSYGGDDKPFRKGFVKINGIQVTLKEDRDPWEVRDQDIRGFTLVRVKDVCSVKEIKSYDTHLNSQESRKMKDYLQTLPNNTRIAGITHDEYNDHLSNSLKSVLNDIGLDLTSASWRSSLCFVFIIGKPQNTKQSQAKGGKGPSILSTIL